LLSSEARKENRASLSSEARKTQADKKMDGISPERPRGLMECKLYKVL
jgi:hypothetical protein